MRTSITAAWTPGLTAAAAMLALTGCGLSGPGTTRAPAAEPVASATAPPTKATPSIPSPTPSSAAATKSPTKIVIKGFKYQGAESVGPGAEISVTNEDVEAHTITADTAAFDAIIKVGTGTFAAPTEPGTYPYHCMFHGNMKGTLIVK